MTDGASIGPEMGVENSVSRGVTLYESRNFSIRVPSVPKIPLKEGLHVEVGSGQDKKTNPKEVLGRLLMGEGVAKVIAESGSTPDAWANTRLEKGDTVSIYGRVPGEESSWRKPVDANDREVAHVDSLEPAYDTQEITKLFNKYMPKWEKLLGKMVLFEGGVDGESLPINEETSTVWKSGKFSIEFIREPHLSGYHLVVNPTDSFERQWQTIRESSEDVENGVMIQKYLQTTLEATAIAMGIRQLLSDGRGEIHNSGNWAGGLKSIEEGGRLSMEGLKNNPKAEKRSHRPDLASEDNKFNTSMHVHVYIPEQGNTVVLPPMSRGEAEVKMKEAQALNMPMYEYQKIIQKWDSIRPPTADTATNINDKLGEGKLNKWLMENVQGSLVDQNSQPPNAA